LYLNQLLKKSVFCYCFLTTDKAVQAPFARKRSSSKKLFINEQRAQNATKNLTCISVASSISEKKGGDPVDVGDNGVEKKKIKKSKRLHSNECSIIVFMYNKP
jgi:hypothetical protein